jgi:hypothetical protein
VTIRTRLKPLEKLAKRAAQEENHQGYRTDEEWLAEFESRGREGFFNSEPDFAKALAFYRDALRKAKSQVDPPWDPPEDFMAGTARHRRLCEWRQGSEFRRVDADGNVLPEGTDVNLGLVRAFYRFPEVQEGWGWLVGMALRQADGVPPVTIAEFEKLVSWFDVNEKRLMSLSRPSCLLEVGDGRKETIVNLRWTLDEGPRGWHAGEVAEQIRRLRTYYGDG